MSNIPKTKVCGVCNIEKVSADFPFRKKISKNGVEYVWLRLQCKKCMNARSTERYYKKREQILEKNKCYYAKNKQKISVYKKQWDSKQSALIKQRRIERYAKKGEEIKAKRKEYYYKNKEKVILLNNDYFLRNKAKMRAAQRLNHAKKKSSDISYSIMKILRSRVSAAIKRGGKKCLKTIQLVGCSMPELLCHLEGLFSEGMSWDNYGDWHIDHKIPCAAFDMSDVSQQLICFNYKNLQPLWAVDNLKKGAKIIY